MTETSSDPMIGRLIDGRYQVRSRIARGGMATVYLATDLRLERRVAIKIMHGHLADDNAFKSRFVQEARSAARLAHPNVVNVFDQGQDADMAYMVMEYLPGITLRDLLKDYGKLTPEQTIDILKAVLSGLAAAHKAGIVHRDLKPENVLLADDGRIKLGDFGLARAASNNTATGQALLGTIAYLSPELVTRGIADARSDIYALGIMTYEMLTGEQPYVGEAPMQIAYQHANDTVPMPSSKVPSTPRELDELVLWATARDPEERPRDARVMLEQLQDIEGLVRSGDHETTAQATMVLPSGFDAALADAETQVFGAKSLAAATAATGAAGAASAADTGDAIPASSSRLAAKAARRKRKGYWLFALIILVAGVAGGTGWYFGAGPGSQIPLPDLVSESPEAAAQTLTDLGLTTTLDTEYSLTVPAGLVSSTKPGHDVRVPKGSTVTLFVSQGARPIALPPLVGLSETDAATAISDLKAVPKVSDRVFHDEVPADMIVSATREGDGADVSQGGDALEGQTINLTVSLGAVPDVTGLSLSDAIDELDSVGLVGTEGEHTYDDDVAEGGVIQATPAADGPVREGSSFSLTISRGPEPVTIPDYIVGMSWSEGKETLTALGLVVSYDKTLDLVAGLLTIASTDPGTGVTVPKGSEITIKPRF